MCAFALTLVSKGEEEEEEEEERVAAGPSQVLLTDSCANTNDHQEEEISPFAERLA